MDIARIDYFTNTSAVDRVRALKGTGIKTVLVNWPNGQPYSFGWDGRDDYDYQPLDILLESLLEEDPDLHFIISFGSMHGAPFYWALDNREELALFNIGKPMQQASLASNLWKKDSSEAALRFASHFNDSKYSSCIEGFFPFSTGIDWHGIGETIVDIPEHEKPKSIEFSVEGDFSKPMKEAFKQYLKNKYKTVDKLRASWCNSTLTFDNISLPTRIEVRSPIQKVRDYFECYNELNAKLALAWSESLKKGAPGKKVFLSLGMTYGWPSENVSSQGSGHNAPELLITSDYIDGFLSSSVLERHNRNPLLRHTAASIRLHNKKVIHQIELYNLNEISIDDQCNEITLGVGYATANGDSIAIAEPNIGIGSMKDNNHLLCRLPYDNEKVRLHLDKILKWHKNEATEDIRSLSEIAVFISPRGSYYRAMEKRFNQKMIDEFRNNVMSRVGLSFDEYIISDFDRVYNNYKAWIIIDCPDMDEKTWDILQENSSRVLFATQGNPITNPHTIRDFASKCGVHIWCDTNDFLFANSSTIVFASQEDGVKKIKLPNEFISNNNNLVDVVTREEFNVDSVIKFESKKGEVKILYSTQQ